MNITFLSAAALLVLLVLGLLLRPLLRRAAPSATASRLALNTAIYRDQIAELERDRAAGSLSEADYDQSRAELQRRLLADASDVDTPPPPSAPAWRAALVLALALPIAAAALYAWLGTPAALLPQATTGHEVTQAQIEQMVATLAARLEKHPEDVKGWVMLARSYKALGRVDDAARAFSRIGDAMNKDPELLAEYADLLATRANGNLDGKPMELVSKALALDPNNTMALALAGTAAYRRQDFPAAVSYWEKLQKLLPPESEDAKSIAEAITEARQKSGGKPESKAVSGTTVSGRVTLAPALADKVQPGDTLFVFARAVGGPPMPLAVLRTRAGDLPLSFTLDDSLALNPQLKLSGAKEVKVEARISKSGNATPQRGDLIGASAVVKPGAKGVDIVIERAVP
ncbi:cytochrome c-type biogenesis protein CcmH precursor [mine drainage metagenome]|uniref:Cytochrome c-type biogenesis protein CcmH n=1 Tax=mine drainage metagenome TaxID=410659 RepID=A0A1J5RTQ0_9ZZZZ